MGNTESHATINQTNNDLFINNTDINTLSEQINQQVNSATLTAAQSCSADMNLQQYINVSNFNTRGNFNFNTNQTQQAVLTFGCVNTSNLRNKTGAELITNINNGINNSVTNEALQALKANAESAAKMGWGGIGNVNSSTNVNAINNYKVDNKTDLNIQNVVKNIVQNNFTAESVSNCISKANTSQAVNMENIHVGGEAFIAIEQNQAQTVFSNCVQESNLGNNILNQTASELGIKVELENKNISKQESESKTKSGAEMQGLGGAFAQFFEGIGNAIGDIFKVPGASISSIVCLLVIGVVIYMVVSKGGDVIAQNPELLAMA